MNNVLKNYFLFVVFCVYAFFARSQETLTLDQAIAIALKNNYSVQIAANNAAIASNNRYPGNAGMLPQLTLNAGGSLATNTTKQHYSSGNEIDKSNVNTDAFNYGAALNWTLFDGFRMFVEYDKLKVLDDMGDLNFKQAIETTVALVINAYYDVVMEKQLLKNIRDAIEIYNEKVRLADTKYTLGSGSKLDLLQSKVDLNVQKSNLMKQSTLLDNSKVTLNQLLSRPTETDFIVADTISITYKPSFDELKTSTFQQNISMKISNKNISLARLSLKEIEAQRYPIIGVGLNYAYTQTDNPAGFITTSKNTGLGPSFSIVYPIFNGFQVNHNYKNAKWNLDNANFNSNNTKLVVESGLLKTFRTFQTNMEALKLEEENYTLAKENVDIALERYRLGSSSALELKIAQQSYEDADNRVVLARYATKISETELMRLNGILVKAIK